MLAEATLARLVSEGAPLPPIVLHARKLVNARKVVTAHLAGYDPVDVQVARDVEGIVVLVQSKDGSWCVTATFDRGGDGRPCSPSAPVVCWTTVVEGRYGDLYT